VVRRKTGEREAERGGDQRGRHRAAEDLPGSR
jgi:hypothetical protein